MSKVTAVGLDVVTEKSGHVVAPVTPSVCLTPAAPSPLPVPYPATGTSNEGIAGASSHTKINGAKIATVGSALKASHGNEPGTLKEIVSHNTAGPVAPLLGAPVVLIEQGMAAITGSPVLINEGPGSTARTAPAPQVKPAMAVGTLVQGAGKGKGGSSGGASDGSDGDDHAGGEGGGGGAGGDSRDAPGGQDGQCSDGHPVDVITGRAYTLPAIDLERTSLAHALRASEEARVSRGLRRGAPMAARERIERRISDSTHGLLRPHVRHGRRASIMAFDRERRDLTCTASRCRIENRKRGMYGGDTCGTGGGGGAGGGGSGGCGGEDIGVAVEADTDCCCSILPDGTMSCGMAASCAPYTTSSPGACDSSTGAGAGGCSASGVRFGAGGGNMDVLVLLLVLAAFRVLRRRFA